MIESFNKIKIDKIIDISLKRGDTLVIKFDNDLYDFDEVSNFIKIIQKQFPKNDIMTIFKGMELGVIHNED